MFNIGPGELMVILLLALILLGPEKLPEVARTVGKGMKELRRASEDLRQTVEQELYKVDLEADAKKEGTGRVPPSSLPPPGAEPLAAPPPPVPAVAEATAAAPAPAAAEAVAPSAGPTAPPIQKV